MRPVRILRAPALVLTLVALLAPTPVTAQTTEDQNHFDLSRPGARSRALGGAFVAIADDATAVYSNPAGLTLLFRPEISLEGRRLNFTSQAFDRGHAFGAASGKGVDTIDGLVERTFNGASTGISFASFVVPGDGWAVGVFHHELARYRMDRQIEGPFFQCSGGFRGTPPSAPFCEPHASVDGVDREFPKRQMFKLDIASTGVAFAYDLPSDISVGVAVQYFRFHIDSENRVFRARGAQKFLPANFADPGNLELIATQQGTDHAVAINAGLLWNATPKVTVGGSFRQGPKFKFNTSTDGFDEAGQFPINRQLNVPYRVPDTWSMGLLYRLTSYWRVSVEYDLVRFGQVVKDLKQTSFNENDAEGAAVVAGIRLTDVHQLRLGGEHLRLLSGGRVLAFRSGLWYEPNHQPYFEADKTSGLPLPRWALLLPKQDGMMHASAGLGLTTSRHFQVDAAADFSAMDKTFSLSGVWRF